MLISWLNALTLPRLEAMTKTQLDGWSSETAEEPPSTTLPTHPEVSGQTGIITDLTTLSTLVTVLVQDDADPEDFPALLAGAASSTRILGLDELHVIAPARHLPKLAVAASEIADELPETFQFCEAETCGHEHPEDSTVLTAESVVGLGRKLAAS